MTMEQTNYIISALTAKGVEFDPGLTNDEVSDVETKFAFHFPPDLRLFLQTSLPASAGFVHWRLGLASKAKANNIIARLNQPLEGALFDVKYNSELWYTMWGPKPATHEERVSIVKQHYAACPRLIPVYSHRFLPDRPNEVGNPVYSVHQTDIIYYGYDLASYFAKEFRFSLPSFFQPTKHPKIIEFWNGYTE